MEKEFDNEELIESQSEEESAKLIECEKELAKSIECETDKDAYKHLKWDNKFNIGHILTFFAIIIAAIGLIFQKRDLDAKINDLSHIVQQLEAEKLERELQDIYGII